MSVFKKAQFVIVAFLATVALLGGVVLAQTAAYWTFDTDNEGFFTGSWDEANMVNWDPQLEMPSAWSPTGGYQDGHVYSGTTTAWDGRFYAIEQRGDINNPSLGNLAGKTLQTHVMRDYGTYVSPSGAKPIAYWFITDVEGYHDCSTYVSKLDHSIDLNALPQGQWVVESIEIVAENFFKWPNCPDGTKTLEQVANGYSIVGFSMGSDEITENASDPWNQWQLIDGVYRLPHYGVTSTTNATFRVDNFGPVDAMTYDFGDLPTAYNTTHAQNGARHQTGGPLMLGGSVESEPDGQPSADATGDGSEEDGVTRQDGAAGGNGWTEGTVANSKGGSLAIDIAGGSGVPQVFIDFNGSHVLTEVTLRDASGAPLTTPLAAGVHRVYFDIPSGTFSNADNAVAVRVRLSSAGGLAATGAAADGEVEDYIWHFKPNAVTLAQFRADSSSLPAWLLPLAFLMAGAALAGWRRQ
ncbi:MAG: hypothetical protein DSY55_05155 [Clostridia bacterium]|nr:MAG: hypothetical protein DSY55_05155 [Clostridia bacterium]